MLCLLVAGSLALTAHPAFAQQTAAPAMSVCQARKTIVARMQQASNIIGLNSPPSGTSFSIGELEFQANPRVFSDLFPRGIYKIDLKNLDAVTVEPKHHSDDSCPSQIFVEGRDPLGHSGFCSGGGAVRKQLSNISILGLLEWRSDRMHRDDSAAQDFANALNVLRVYARNYESSRDRAPVCFAEKDEQARIWAEFQKRAAAWRALPAKPPISDDVKRNRLLAEDAYQQKQFDTAAAEYEAGLEIDPLWAQGHFNAALIYGELKDYDDAVWHMRCYLELLPNAPDAQEARDQMLLWQGKAKQQTAAQ
jgi:tetratricopeptide (TPR) repeat protein